MLRGPTIDKLQTLRLTAMAAAWEEQGKAAEYTAMSFDERFALLVEAEWTARESKRLARALREAKLSQACIEDLEYHARRELDRSVVRQLATCGWVMGRPALGREDVQRDLLQCRTDWQRFIPPPAGRPGRGPDRGR